MFKIGDKVSHLSAGGDRKVGILTNNDRCSNSPRHLFCIDYEDGGQVCVVHEDDLQLIESSDSKGIVMNLKEKFALAFKSEPEKSFREAGITDSNDLFTPDGQIIFLSWLLKKHGEEFKKEVVDPILDEYGVL